MAVPISGLMCKPRQNGKPSKCRAGTTSSSAARDIRAGFNNPSGIARCTGDFPSPAAWAFFRRVATSDRSVRQGSRSGAIGQIVRAGVHVSAAAGAFSHIIAKHNYAQKFVCAWISVRHPGVAQRESKALGNRGFACRARTSPGQPWDRPARVGNGVIEAAGLRGSS